MVDRTQKKAAEASVFRSEHLADRQPIDVAGATVTLNECWGITEQTLFSLILLFFCWSYSVRPSTCDRIALRSRNRTFRVLMCHWTVVTCVMTLFLSMSSQLKCAAVDHVPLPQHTKHSTGPNVHKWMFVQPAWYVCIYSTTATIKLTLR